MTTIMSVKCKMNDLNAFKQVYEASLENNEHVGIIASTMYHDPNDPNMITVLHQFKDLETAQKTAVMWGSEEVKAAISEQGYAQMDTFELNVLHPVA